MNVQSTIQLNYFMLELMKKIDAMDVIEPGGGMNNYERKSKIVKIGLNTGLGSNRHNYWNRSYKSKALLAYELGLSTQIYLTKIFSLQAAANY